MFRPLFFLLWKAFASGCAALASALLTLVNLHGCQSCHMNGESRPLAAITSSPGELLRADSCTNPHPSKVFSWMRILQINFEIIAKPD